MTEQPEQLIVNGIRVYAALSGGNLWCMVRATDKATFDAQALSVKLKVYTNPAQPEVLDEDGNVVTPAVPASGPLIPAKGITITEIGPLVLTPAVLDAEGTVVTPAVMDNRYHANFWLGPAAVARGEWEGWGVLWSIHGADATPNHLEEGVGYGGIELIDPMTVSSASNVLL